MSDNRILLCGIGKLENNYIKEWVEYHKNMGFTNIVLYDNNDIDGERFEDVIGNHIKSGYVILKNWRGKDLAQIPSYNSCYEEYKDNYDWIAYWDIDEFIHFEKAKTIQEFVKNKKFEKVQCIRICWKQYTDSNLIKVENNNFSIKRFKEVLDANFCKKNNIPIARYKVSNTQAKSIVRTNIKNFKVTSPHCFLNVPTVDANGGKCDIGIRIGETPVWKGAWLNHYRFKTIEEYVTKKMVRLWPTAYMNGGKDRLDLDYFFMFNKKTIEKIKYAKALKDIDNTDKIRINSWTEFDDKGNIKKKNWGDELNYFFLSKLFNKELVEHAGIDIDNYLFIGSILSDKYIDKNTIIWGSGIQIDQKLKKKPKKVCAVRGPLTRKFLIENGIDCPKIYGDPSLLLPYYYYPDIPKKYEIGLIPHWSSLESSIVTKLSRDKKIHLIKLRDYKNWLEVINEILSCKYIVSESLHGLIMAEAYNIPNLWVDITLKNIYDIKYHDFFLSIGHDREKSYKLNYNTTVKDLQQKLSYYQHSNMIDAKALVDACPIKITNKEFLENINNNKFAKKKNMSNQKYEKGVSICLTAYKEEKYIEEALDSIKNQTWFKTHNNYEILLGIDNHYGTLKKVQEIRDKYTNLRVFMMDKNVGTYITTNTMMTIAKYDTLIRFDSDDIMLPNMVEKIVNNISDCDVLRFQMKNFGTRHGTYMACGQIGIKHEVFDKFGGYQAWTCSADSELETRVHKFAKVKKLSEVLFNRRIHSQNLTVAKATNFSSKVRKQNLDYVAKLGKKLKKFEDAFVKRITGEYIEIFNDTDISQWQVEEPIPEKQETKELSEIAKQRIERAKKRYNFKTLKVKRMQNIYGSNQIY